MSEAQLIDGATYRIESIYFNSDPPRVLSLSQGSVVCTQNTGADNQKWIATSANSGGYYFNAVNPKESMFISSVSQVGSTFRVTEILHVIYLFQGESVGTSPLQKTVFWVQLPGSKEAGYQ
ncbi:hypothetical protein Clacol_007820 [Clathrus columnatus]|uniref:Ricin B lectin domain-containing protein n=1 Tax=Clathrus columnatus TaxID=1419009 RepID=A0AAV5AL15_9AGAM|nr:hypothetical protein Clacol_007820 [Clathrus columnatus]